MNSNEAVAFLEEARDAFEEQFHDPEKWLELCGMMMGDTDEILDEALMKKLVLQAHMDGVKNEQK